MLSRVHTFVADATRTGLRRRPSFTLSRTCRFFSSDQHDAPLRVLFCGSDDFSITCLRALHQYHQSPNSNVASIDVATKTDKRTGRGLKVVKPPPIKLVSRELGLPIHQFDTFRGWNLPTLPHENHINLVIAVSFGLLVPPRILEACHFGGLNVHPSMLPDLKGSAPIEHAIIHGYENTGVTIQTLHPSKFDEGEIVLQTPHPGVAIPDPDHITVRELRQILAEIGSKMLVRSLQERLYLNSRPQTGPAHPINLNHAPKLSPESRHISFENMTSTQILRLNRAIGHLWVRVTSSTHAKSSSSDMRLICSNNIRLAQPDDFAGGVSQDLLSLARPGMPFRISCYNHNETIDSPSLFVRAQDGKYLCIPEVSISGLKPGTSSVMAAQARLFNTIPAAENGNIKVYEFAQQPS